MALRGRTLSRAVITSVRGAYCHVTAGRRRMSKGTDAGTELSLVIQKQYRGQSGYRHTLMEYEAREKPVT